MRGRLRNKTNCYHPVIDRILKELGMIARGRATATTMSAELEVSTKTVHRDIEFLRDRLSLPIVFDSKKNEWRIEKITFVPAWLQELKGIFNLFESDTRPGRQVDAIIARGGVE